MASFTLTGGVIIQSSLCPAFLYHEVLAATMLPFLPSSAATHGVPTANPSFCMSVDGVRPSLSTKVNVEGMPSLKSVIR